MKYLLFIFTLYFIGRDIDAHGETDTEAADEQLEYSGDEISEDLPPAENLLGNGAPPISSNNNNDPSYENEDNSAGEASGDQEGSGDNDVPVDRDHHHGESANIPPHLKPKFQQLTDTIKLYVNEMAAGDPSDLVGQNQHVEESSVYHDLGRRADESQDVTAAEKADYLTPEKAPRELVLLVAEQSKLLAADKDNDTADFDQNKILRSGNYWDGVWKEDVVPESLARSRPQEKRLGSIKARINPGTKFYKMVSRMKKISPKLLYIMNKP